MPVPQPLLRPPAHADLILLLLRCIALLIHIYPRFTNFRYLIPLVETIIQYLLRK